MHQADLRPLDVETISHQAYDPTHFQPVLFGADSFDEMDQNLRTFLEGW